MYDGQKILAVVCARGGSKGIPGKNIKLLAGKPLIAYSIEVGLQCPWVDKVLVSTDDLQIKKVAERYGADVPFLRPKKLANDTIGRIASVIDAVEKAEKIYKQSFDIIIDLGNMAPLRNQEDMKNVIQLLVDNTATDVVFSVTPSGRNPYYNMVEINEKGYAVLSKKTRPLPSCRQDAPPTYDMNDSIYAIRKKSLFKHKNITVPIQLVTSLRKRAYVMPEERSVDIDRLLDFKLVELLITEQRNK